MAHVLAIDQSTSATKAIVFDSLGNVVDNSSRDHHQIYPQPGWVEHDAEEIWRNTLAALKSLLENNRERVGDIACLSITNQRETFVVFDRATGKPLHNAIVWHWLCAMASLWRGYNKAEKAIQYQSDKKCLQIIAEIKRLCFSNLLVPC